MKKAMTKLLAGVFCSLMLVPAYADEGMWVLSMLSKRSQKQMKELGLKLSAKELYSADGPSFKDAIVSFGGFCSGVVVSPDGLVFTNHHCGYGSIQEHSTPEHDYLKNGFVARSFEEELPNPDLRVSFLIRTEDVTERVESALTDGMGLARRREVVDSVARVIETEAVGDNKLLRAEVASYYQGNEYYLSVYKDYKDVRLVYAPPSSLGKFGGDTDNWMWPRHTCDFSVFRIYADANNEPAEYSPENRPYKASAYAPVSLKGYEEGDFCMTMGYPGSTNRYLSSFGVDERMKTDNAARIQIRGIKQDIWTKYMDRDDATRIKYASKFAQSSNYWKNSIGMNQSITDLGVIGQKQDLERRLRTWIEGHADMQKKYGTMLPALEKAYRSRFEAARARSFYEEALLGSAELPELVAGLLNAQAMDDAARQRIAAGHHAQDLCRDCARRALSPFRLPGHQRALQGRLPGLCRQRLRPHGICHGGWREAFPAERHDPPCREGPDGGRGRLADEHLQHHGRRLAAGRRDHCPQRKQAVRRPARDGD